MLDVNDFITQRGGNPDRIRESQRRRGASVELVDKVIALWEEARAAQYAVARIGTEINSLQKQIGLKKKAKDDASELLQKKATVEQNKKAQEIIAAEKQAALRALVKTVGNYVADSVPVSQNEDDNETIRTWAPEGFDEKRKPGLSHHEVLQRLDGYDPIRGVKLVGHRGYCLTGYGLFLNMALINYGVEFLFQRDYTPNQPPFFLNHEQMAKTAQLSQFHEELYRVSEGSDADDNLKYLIATSEQPLSCMHAGEWLQPNQLPIRYCGYSTCFRKEAGSHGHDAWTHFDEMIATSEEFYKSLGLPYRIVSIVSGALNNAAAKKYDLEAWFPFQGEYKELVSCSNCTNYQTRELDIRYGVKKAKDSEGGKEFVHALNATLCATQRTLCCIMENYQTADGFVVPEVLRKYIPGQPDFLPFVKDLPRLVAKAAPS